MNDPSTPPESVEISHIGPCATLSDAQGAVNVHSPMLVLMALFDSSAVLDHDSVTMTEDSVLLIPSSYSCQLNPCSAEPMKLAAIEFSFQYCNINLTNLMPDVPSLISGKSAEHLKEDIIAICTMTGSDSPIRTSAGTLAAGYRIASVLAEEFKLDADKRLPAYNRPGVRTLLNYLDENYPLPVTVDDMAVGCDVSRRQIFKVAAYLDNLTPMKLLKKIRFEKSLGLMQNKDLGVNQISERVGFNDPKNFSREFKLFYGMTPSTYRQQSPSASRTLRLAQQADIKLSENDPKAAGKLYAEAVKGVPSWKNADELYYKLGLARKQAGDSQAADQAWSHISNLQFRLQIDMHQCEAGFNHSRAEFIVKQLKHIYAYGNQNLREQVVKRLGDWMSRHAFEGRFTAAAHLADFGRDVISEFPALKEKLAQTLFRCGQYDDVLNVCPDQKFYVAAALRATGRFEEHLERFPGRRSNNAQIHLNMGHTDIVLQDFQDIDHSCARALIFSMRAEEAVTRYPKINATALLALGRYDEVLLNHPDDATHCAWALARTGKKLEALERAGHKLDLKADIWLYFEQTEDIRSSLLMEGYHRITATLLHAIHLLETKEYRAALKLICSIAPMTDSNYHHGTVFYERDLLIPLILHALSDVTAEVPESKWLPWRDHFAAIIKDGRYCYAQRHWFDMRYILGEINDSQYYDQPHRMHAESRLEFTKGLKADFLDNSEAAIRHYHSYHDAMTEAGTIYFMQYSWPVLRAFIRWRLKELA